MGARRLWSTVVVSLCSLVWVFGSGVVSIAAGATLFGNEGAGRVGGATGVGIDRASGDVYVPDMRGNRVDEYEASGGFLMGLGWGVNEEDPAEELQTCTVCQVGVTGSRAGQFGGKGFGGDGPEGLAVDDNGPLVDSSAGDVYVLDREGNRVEKFDSSGKFLLMFGGGVNETSGGDVCVAGEKCTDGARGTADGQFEFASPTDGVIAVGPGGAVYVGDEARVEVFEASGAWKENLSLTGWSSTGKVTALAVNTAGDVFVKDQGVPGVHELEPGGIEAPVKFDELSESVEAIALDGAGDVFVADPSGGFHVMEYSSAGVQTESFGSKTATNAEGMAFSDALNELYVASAAQGVWILTAPAPGPLVEVGSEAAIPGQRGTASLEASVDPEGSATTVSFEYVDQAAYQSSGFAGASSTPGVVIGSTFSDQSASASLSGLLVGGTYHYRVVAANANGTVRGADQSFTTIPAAVIEGPWASDLASTSVTLGAEINPLGASTEYRLEYGITTSYGQILSGSVGEGTSPVLVSHHLQELVPNTLYHYRLVTDSYVGTIEGSDQTFMTQGAAGQLTLPDGRTWELVSPANKKGALIEFLGGHDIQAASDGSAITYTSNEPIGEAAQGRENLSQTLSRRTATGWRSQDLDVEQELPEEGLPNNSGLAGKSNQWYQLFSPDLSSAVISPPLESTRLSPEATERTLYRKDIATGAYLPLVTPADVPPNTGFGGTTEYSKMYFLQGTPDLSHIILESPFALTPGAPYGQKIYEWSAGRLQLVSAPPQGLPASMASEPNLGRSCCLVGMVAHSVSNDGRWVVWTSGLTGSSHPVRLYVRDTVGEKTIRVGGQYARFESMSSDGSRIFFMEDNELYVFDVATRTQVDITANHGVGETNAGVQDAILGISEDGSSVYFVATGALAGGAHPGEDNLYISHRDGAGWTTAYVTTLSSEDQNDWINNPSVVNAVADDLSHVTSRVSANGIYVSFMSERSLTGYDNRDANSGQPDEEVYLYDSASARLVCTSCDPTGARPAGTIDAAGTHELLVDPSKAWTRVGSGVDHWLAGSIPTWERGESNPLYQPRFLSDSGRLFFDSADALVPQDTNGLEDVYQYEPAGVGDCTTSTVSFVGKADGCVSLITSGTAASESAFYDASESGDDVFFITASRLTSSDYDNGYDVYDAHACSAAVPCTTASVSPPPCTSGDSCKAAPSPQPEIFGPAPSATFSGTGNVAVTQPVLVTHKSVANARRRMAALRACRKKKSGKRRVVCERQARKRYPAQSSRAGQTTKRGGGR